MQTLISRTRLSKWEIFIGALGLVLFVFLTAERGDVYETEFSPDQLAFRSRHYFCYSFLGTGSEWVPPVLARVREFDDGQVPPTSPSRWHFVHGDKPGVRGWIGEARWAYRLFRDESWLEWTDKHPELAKRFWPKVIHLLRQERYGQVATALVFARDATTNEEIDHALAEAEKE